MAQGRRDRRAGADHGRAPCRASVADRRRQGPRASASSPRSSSTRPSSARRRISSATRATRPATSTKLAEAGVDLVFIPRHGRDVSRGLCHQSEPAEPHRGSVRRRAAQSFRGRGHGGDQAAPAMRARRRGVRREGLSAAPRHQAAGARSQHSGRDRRRADRARRGRARAVIAQWLSLRRRAQDGANPPSGSEPRPPRASPTAKAATR